MNLADVFTFLFVILGFVIAFVSYWLFAAGLFPGMVERSAEQLGKRPIALLLLGAVTLGPLLIIGGQLSGKGPNGGAKLLGAAIALLPMLGALFGSAGLALRIGAGLRSARDESDPWRRVLRGGIVLGLAFVLPLVGTFLVMPYAFFAGFGAFLLCLFRRSPVRAVGSAATPDPCRVKLSRRRFVLAGAAAALAGCDRPPAEIADSLRRWMGHPAAPPLEGAAYRAGLC